MKRLLHFGVGKAVLLALCGWVSAADPVEVEVEVAGLRVVGSGHGEGASRISPLNWRRGTTVALLVKAEGGSILNLDPWECVLEVFEDDKGTNLRPEAGTARPVFGPFPERSRDGGAVLLEIWGDALAAEEARELRVKGELVFTVGREKRRERTEKIVARAGAAAVLGDRTVSVISGIEFPDEVGGEAVEEAVGAAEAGGEGGEGGKEDGDGDGDDAGAGIILSVRIDGEPDEVKNVRVLDAQGEPVAVEELGVRVVRRGGDRAIHRFGLPEGFDGEISIEADLWDGVGTLRVPFEKRITVGLGGKGGG